jgi:hypothetical protein
LPSEKNSFEPTRRNVRAPAQKSNAPTANQIWTLGRPVNEYITMSIDTTFKPFSPSFAVASGAPVQSAAPVGVTTFRIVNTTAAAAARVSWGKTAALTPVPAAPGPNSILIQLGGVLYIEVPGDSFFNVSAAATVEITGGQGGVGG